MAMLSIDFCANELESSIRLKRPKRKATSCIGSRAHVEVVRAEAEELRRAQRWGEMRPSHLVALWAWLHEQVYKVAPEPGDMSPKAFSASTLLAGRTLRESFGGDAARMVGFMRWVWRREVEQKKRRPDGRRIGARLQFCAGLVSDWRVATAGKVG